MLNIIYEFRKGIFFIRLTGTLNKDNYLKNEEIIKKIILINKFKYIVVNTNYLEKADLEGLSLIAIFLDNMKEYDSNLLICDRYNILNRLFNINIPNIKDELEVLY